MKTEETVHTDLAAAEQAMSDLWDEHVRSEFANKDAHAAIETMVPDAYVNLVPVLTGGVGRDQVENFYSHHFIPHTPPDIEIVPVSRTVGSDRLVDELILRFTHSMEMDWMLPGVPPTGKRVECATVAVITFRDGKMLSEHLYWDQASVLVQLGLLDASSLPVAGAATARKVADHTLPSNELMARTAPPSSSVAFKRRPSPETTLDVFGVDVTLLVQHEDTAGRFGVVEYVSKPGLEPPPHWHEWEDEVFYLIEGQLEMHCGDQVFHVEPGECVFLPKRKPHGFIVRSPRMRAVCVIQPSGAEQAFRILGLPKNGTERRLAGSTYMTHPDDLRKVALQFGVHNLTREEIAVSMPHFPIPPAA